MDKNKSESSVNPSNDFPVDDKSSLPAGKPTVIPGIKGFISVLLFTVVVLSLIFFWHFNRSSDAAPSKRKKAGKPPVVTVSVITEKEINPPREYVGRMEAIQAVDLRARVKGYLEEVRFKEGSDVRQGDLLYVIEQAPYRAKVNENNAKVAEAEANLTRTRQYLQRLRSVRTGGVSESDLEAAISAQLQAKAQLQEAEASLEQAELDLGYTKIFAPISGRIGRTAYTRGNLVGPESGALARIVQINPIRVVYSVSDSDFAGTGLGWENNSMDGSLNECRQVTRLKLSDSEIYPELGQKDFVDNQVDPETGTIAVRAIFDNPWNILLPGQYVTVMISCVKGKHLPMVPQAAVQEDRDGRYVFVVNNEQTVVQRRIATGNGIGTEWAVESGLISGDVVVVQGVQKIRPGQIVKTVTADKKSSG